jgi:hypothetical protein
MLSSLLWGICCKNFFPTSLDYGLGGIPSVPPIGAWAPTLTPKLQYVFLALTKEFMKTRKRDSAGIGETHRKIRR